MARGQLTEERKRDLLVTAGRVFVPASPVSRREFFAGRLEQLARVLEATYQIGQHAIVFGERGVGKTSLANILAGLQGNEEEAQVFAPRINCDNTDTFESVWKKVFEQIPVQSMTQRTIGFHGEYAPAISPVSEAIEERLTPSEVAKILMRLSQPQNNVAVIVILDEFDRLRNNEARRSIADTIKVLSDRAVPVTIVLVGVADSVQELIAEHQSIERALIQVQMPRMSLNELQEILDKGMGTLDMTMEDATRRQIGLIAQGLPHYAHALGLYSTQEALYSDSLVVSLDHLYKAIIRTTERAPQSLRSSYEQAIYNPRRKNIYPQVLLACAVACALAKTDAFGFFTAAAVREPMSAIAKKDYKIAGFKRNLDDFTTPGKGAILQRTGQKRGYRYRFADPLLPSLAIMDGLTKKWVTIETLRQLIAPKPRHGTLH